MKTTCLIPVPVNEWIQRNPNNGPYNVYIGGKTPSNFFYEKDKEIHFGITHVLVPQSGYFFTEEEMKRILSVASSEEKLQQFAKSLDLDFTKLSNEALAWRTCFEYVTQLILKP